MSSLPNWNHSSALSSHFRKLVNQHRLANQTTKFFQTIKSFDHVLTKLSRFSKNVELHKFLHQLQQYFWHRYFLHGSNNHGIDQKTRLWWWKNSILKTTLFDIYAAHYTPLQIHSKQWQFLFRLQQFNISLDSRPLKCVILCVWIVNLFCALSHLYFC